MPLLKLLYSRMMILFLITIQLFYANISVAGSPSSDMTPLYRECLINLTMETGEWSEECEKEVEREFIKSQ